MEPNQTHWTEKEPCVIQAIPLIHVVVWLELGYFCVPLLVIDLSELQVSIRSVIIDVTSGP